MYLGIIYVQMEESSARSYTKIYRLVIKEWSLIKHNEINFDSIVYTTYVKEMSYLHTHNIQWYTLINDLFGDVKSCDLRGEGM